MKNAVEITIDSAGRLVVPKAIREEAGVRPGLPLRITLREGRIEIEPAPRKIRIVEKDGLHVAVPREKSTALTAETVRKTLHRIRNRRTRD